MPQCFFRRITSLIMITTAWFAAVAALCVASVSAQQQNTSPIPIISYVNEGVNADGSYQWSYETGNGIKAQEQGELKNAGSENEGIAAQGSFSFTADDGQTYSITYTADENGFQPQGAHLPTPPPIPEAILRSLEFNEKNPEPEDAQQNGGGGGGAPRRPGGPPAYGRRR